MAAATGTEFPMGGVSVKFPYKPYPPQKAMMAKIIKALSNSENALLESPTGSGKSLALLCSALAWQKNASNQLVKKDEEERLKVLNCDCKCHVKEEVSMGHPQGIAQPQPPSGPRPPTMFALGQQPHMVALGQQPHMVAIGQQPHMVAIGQQPRMVALGQQPHMVAIGQQPHMVAIGQQPRMVAIGQQPRVLSSADIGTAISPIVISGTPPNTIPAQGTSASFGKPVTVQLLPGPSNVTAQMMVPVVTLATASPAVKPVALQLPQMMLSKNVPSLLGGDACSEPGAVGLGDGVKLPSMGGSTSTLPNAGLDNTVGASAGASNGLSTGPGDTANATTRCDVPDTGPGGNSVSNGPIAAGTTSNEPTAGLSGASREAGVTWSSAGTSKEEEGAVGNSKAVKSETQEVPMEVIAAQDDDDDFKPSKKRFRKAVVKKGPAVKKRKGGAKGVKYENDGDSDKEMGSTGGNSPVKWKMEFPWGVAPGIGIPQSQIMDTGVIKSEACAGSSSVTPSDGTTGMATRVKSEIAATTSTQATSAIPMMTSGMTPAMTSGMTPAMTPMMYSGAKSFTTPGLPVSCQQCDCAAIAAKNNSPDRTLRTGYPKIYFATRTHKQITQIARELRKSAYHDTPMCILASRDHTCIHPEVSKSKTKTDDCRKLLDYDEGSSCPFFYRVSQKLGSQAQLRQLGLTTAWDIEDLLKVGRKVKTCPYYATRGLVEEADIIFCPYNYLIDPIIRDQMQIDIENRIIILDEAHNIEDNARDAASLSITSEELSEVTGEIEEILPLCRQHAGTYQHLNALIQAILRWINTTALTLPARGYEQAFGVWNGQDFLNILDKSFGITEASLQTYKSHLQFATEAALDKNNDKNDEEKRKFPPDPTLSTISLNRIKSILVVLEYIFKENKKYVPDYRMSLMKSTAMRQQSSAWHRKGRKKESTKVWIYTLNFWCQNPAVAFLDLARCRSIILTSGTLSPLTSFASELGMAFPITLEASHVISEAQTWVRTVSQGPNGISLSATYQNSETFEFKDELGRLVCGVCETVPFGVLCFMSSYSMLEKLTTRWQETGLWDQIHSHKFIVCEPRTGGKEVFDEVMRTYYQEISDAEERQARGQLGCDGQRTGALFLAVCRGKVSEGLDFSDNNARTVITIGIPYPNFKSKQIELKREYNNTHCRQRGLLNGSEWYDIQAYRALNQALGRCLRHKRDWGALILVDARYKKGNHYIKGLSRWVRQRVRHEWNFLQAMVSLKEFVATMMKSDLDGTINESKSSISILEKSPSSSSASLGSSMTSPPAPFRPPSAPTISSSSSSTSLFVINSPSAIIPDQFQVTPPRVVAKADPLTSTPLSSHLLNSPGGCRGEGGGATSQVPSGNGKQYPNLMPMSEILLLESQRGAMCCSKTAPPGSSCAADSCCSKTALAGTSCATGSCCSKTGTSCATDSAYDDSTLIMLNDAASDSAASAASTVVYPSDQECGAEDDKTPPHPSVIPSMSPRSNMATSSPLSVTTPSETLPSAAALTAAGITLAPSVSIPSAPSMSPVPGITSLPVPSKLVPPGHLPGVTGPPRTTPPIPDTPPDDDSPLMFEPGNMDFDFEAPVYSINPPAATSPGTGKAPLQHQEPPSDTNHNPRPLTRKANLRKSARMKSSATYASVLGPSSDEAVRCSCGEVVAESGERIELKMALSRKFGQCKVKDIHSSSLWTHLNHGKTKSKVMEVFIAPSSVLKASVRKGCHCDEVYNAVWEEELGLCYSLLDCPAHCERVIGVLIHATTSPASQQLAGKAIISV